MPVNFLPSSLSTFWGPQYFVKFTILLLLQIMFVNCLYLCVEFVVKINK